MEIKVLKQTFETESGFFGMIVTDRQYNFLANACIVMFLLQKSSISVNIWITGHSSTFIQTYILTNIHKHAMNVRVSRNLSIKVK